jgi:hypothetical protein
MDVPRLQGMETGSMTIYWTKEGYAVVGPQLCLVWDRKRFVKHLTTVPLELPNMLRDWCRSFDPPVTYYNGYIWIYSPGPPPDHDRYSS